MKVGIFGGSFNPPHIGHQMICLWAISTKAVDELFIIPCNESRDGKKLISYSDRLHMCSLMGSYINSNSIYIKGDLFDGKTYPLLKHLERNSPHMKFCFIGGPDLDIDNWYEADKLKKEFEIIRFPLQIEGVRSTIIRDAISNNRCKEIQYKVPEKIYRYIINNNLYKLGDNK